MNTVSTLFSSGEPKAYKNGQLPLRLPGEPVPGEKKKIMIPIFMLNATVASFSQATNGQHRGFLEEKASKWGRYRRLAAQQVWSSFATFSTSFNSGTLETLVQGEVVRKNKENKEELELEDAKTLQADQLQHLQSHLLLLRLR